MKNIPESLAKSIEEELIKIEEKGDIVITTTVLKESIESISNAVMTVYAGDQLSVRELMFFRQLAMEASHNEKMFRGELSALTGFSEKEAEELGERLRKLTSWYN